MEFTQSRKVAKPLQARVVLVRPIYQLNIGLAARAAKNFGVVELALVSPQCEIGNEAYKYAKHSKEVLDKAKICNTIAQATRGCDVVIGTTGVVRRFTGRLKNCISSAELPEHIAGKKVAFVFGSEDKGLGEEEIEQCDLVCHIPADKAHPVLNLAHAVAVILYAAYYSRRFRTMYKLAKREKINYLNVLFSQIVDEVAQGMPPIRDVEKTKLAFAKIIGRAKVGETEAQTLFAALGRIRKALKKKL